MEKAKHATEAVENAQDDGLRSARPRSSSVDGHGMLMDTATDDAAVQVIGDEAVIRLLEEELSVDRRRIETGRVRIHRETREVVQSVDEELIHDLHEIETVAIGAFVEQRPLIRETDDEIIIPIVEEVLVVERRLRLKEELHIRKKRVSEHYREEVVLRVQEAHVSRLPPKPSRGND
ncbi:MAG: YsnF/AvaK domain-containing protein [Rhodobacterales bacterium]|nr:YsnF/AvaK domain-containing protein [Rhodobacterales bacterium]